MVEGERVNRCATCAAWQRGPTASWRGTCRRFPPGVGEDGAAEWPLTDGADWCLGYVPDAEAQRRLAAELRAMFQPTEGGRQ